MTFTPAQMPKQRPDHTTPVRVSDAPFTLTERARKHLSEHAWDEEQVLAAANDPSLTYGNGPVAHQRRHMREGFTTIVDLSTRKIVAVYKDA
jgi:hypothetical protein